MNEINVGVRIGANTHRVLVRPGETCRATVLALVDGLPRRIEVDLDVQGIVCPDPAAHHLECADDNPDQHGDCDGPVREYTTVEPVLGVPAGGSVLICGAHAQRYGRYIRRMTADAPRARAAVRPAPERRLRSVPPPALAVPVTTVDPPARAVQIAGMPGAYAVRRAGVSEAILHRSDTGGWYVMYGYDPAAAPGSVEQWQGTALLPGRLNDDDAVQACGELVAAYELGVRGWHQLVAGAQAVPHLLPLVRLHRPVLDDDGIWCAGDHGDPPAGWYACQTVLIIAGCLGVDLRVLPVPDKPSNG